LEVLTPQKYGSYRKAEPPSSPGRRRNQFSVFLHPETMLRSLGYCVKEGCLPLTPPHAVFIKEGGLSFNLQEWLPCTFFLRALHCGRRRFLLAKRKVPKD